MPNALPKYVRKRGKDSLQYRRKLSGYEGEFTRAMACKQNSLESEIQKEAMHCTKLYELELKRRAATSPDIFTDRDVDELAAQLLRDASVRDSHKWQAGSLYPPQSEKVIRSGGVVADEPVSEFWADEVVGIDDLIEETHGRDLTVDEELSLKVMRRAKDSLLKRRRRPPRYLSQVLDWYCTNKKDKEDWPTEGREYNRRNNRFLEIMTHIGDMPTEDPEADRRINAGLEAYADHKEGSISVRTGRRLKGQSIKRDLKDSLAAFRRVSKVFKLGWVIEAPEVSEQAETERETLIDEEQEALVAWCLKTNDKFAAILLAQLHGGLMASEILRMGEDTERSLILEGSTPYLLIKEKVKDAERIRLIPLVVGLDVMRQNLAEGITWLSSCSESNHSKILKNKLLAATGNPRLTAHCLRHTWNSNASAAGIDLLHRALIGGWAASGKDSMFSKRMTRYGAKGLQRSKVVIALAESQSRVLEHLLAIEPPVPSNVVSINRRG